MIKYRNNQIKVTQPYEQLVILDLRVLCTAIIVFFALGPSAKSGVPDSKIKVELNFIYQICLASWVMLD